jgi:ubiquinone/menaquinone biosynthesis C-methylase UbiE
MSETASWQVSNDAAVVYEQKFVPALFGSWPPSVADAAGIGSGDHVLDVACGTGVLAREASKRVGPEGSVTGLDLNEGMLAVAKRVQPDVDWRQGDAAALPFEDGYYDVVVSQFALMYFPERVAALREMWRVLKPGGRLAVASWASFEKAQGYRVLAEIAERRTNAEAAAILRSPFVLGEVDELLSLYRDAGIDRVELKTREDFAHFPSTEEFVSAEVKGSPLDDLLSEAEYQALLNEAEEGLAAFRTTDGRIAMPMAAHIVTACKR